MVTEAMTERMTEEMTEPMTDEVTVGMTEGTYISETGSSYNKTNKDFHKGERNVKDLVKKNQLMISALAIMIAIAGYLQFAGKNLDEEYLTVTDEAASVVDSKGVITDNIKADALEELDSLDTDVTIMMEDYLDEEMKVGKVTPEDGEIPGEAVFTSVPGTAMLSDAKLLKEQTRAKNKETLMSIINSEGLTDEQKQNAVDSMVQMTVVAEKESAAEILLEAKGFNDVVVSIADGMVDVVVNAAELDEIQRAQIEDIVYRKTGISGENIVISTVAQ